MELLLIWLIASSVISVSTAQGLCSSSQFACSNGKCILSSYTCDRENDCGDNSDEIGCVCYEGEIRLTGTGSTGSRGNVELCIANQSYAICGRFWSSEDAKVVCRQLGFNSSSAYNSSLFGPSTPAFTLTNVAFGCNGTESYLFLCSFKSVTVPCSTNYPAAVSCSTPYCPSTKFQCNNGLCINKGYVCDGYNDCRDNSDETSCTCTRGMVRLQGGLTLAQGTVEVCANNEWGAVCDNLWTAAEAKVVCNELGYIGGTAVSGSYYGPGIATTYWSDVGGCTGSENIITACAFTTQQTCTTSHYAGVSCYDQQALNLVAAIGGGVGGAIVLLIVVCTCVCIACCLCKRSKSKTRSNKTLQAPQLVAAQTQTSSNVVIIQQTIPQNNAVPQGYYPSQAYSEPPPLEPYPGVPSSYAAFNNGMGYPPVVSPYGMDIPEQVSANLYNERVPVSPSAPPMQ